MAKNMKQAPKKKSANKVYAIRDLKSIQDEFYKIYDPDYWLYKINLLKNCHDNFDEIKEVLTKEMSETVDGDYKRVLRTELHFTYFQMIETLFEIVFAVSKHDNKYLWLALTFSNDRKSPFYSDIYKEIEQLSRRSNLFSNKTKIKIGNNETEVSLLRWIFYFVYPLKLNEDGLKKNFDNIQRLLLHFAKNFSDRGEYNAYKHSLRFYDAGFSLAIGETNSKMFSIGKSENAITYLEEHKKKEGDRVVLTGKVNRTTKPFDFERDYRCCLIIYEMIKNIIHTRKFSLLPEFHGKELRFTIFADIDVIKCVTPNTGLTRSSFTA